MPERPFCEPGLETTYGIKFSAFTSLDAGGPLTKKALQQGKIQVGLVFSSDGGHRRVRPEGARRRQAPAERRRIVATVNSRAVSDKLTAALNSVAAALTTDDLIALNKKVDIDGGDPAQVAQDWLSQQGPGLTGATCSSLTLCRFIRRRARLRRPPPAACCRGRRAGRPTRGRRRTTAGTRS